MNTSLPFNKDSRILSWKILKQENIDTLPVSTDYFIKKYGLKLWTYSYYANLCECSIEEIEDEYDSDGFIFLFKGEFIIVYNESKNPRRINWTVMHEICHFLLGHITNQNPVLLRSNKEKAKLDIEADNMVSRLFCPSAVLHMCCVQSADEIMELCDISHAAATIRWSHLQSLREKDKFLVLPEEKETLIQFLPFISSYLCKKNKIQS